MLIGITGRIGSGKDSVASIVQELYPELNWQIKGFADKLRQVASLLTGIPAEDMKKQEVKEQFLGPEWSDFKCNFNCFNEAGKWTEMEDVMDLECDGTLLSVVNSISSGFPSKNGVDFADWSSKPPSIRSRITLRTLLQRLGTEAIRDGLNKNSWCNALMADYKNVGPYKWNPGNYTNTCLECDTVFYNGAKLQRICENCCNTVGVGYPNWLICDTRFPNEYQAITSCGGICIRIVRPDNPHPQSNHESETALDGVELLTIINDGSLEQLRLRVKDVFDPIVKNLGK